MARTKTKKRRTAGSSAADNETAAGLAQLLESLLAKSQVAADRLSDLLEHSEGITNEDAGAPGRVATTPPSTVEQLETARAVAEAADKAKSCFLAAMSRELRTPVDGLARMIELLRQTDVDDEQRRYLRTASQSVCALLSLLDSVLSLSKVDAGVIDLRTTDFELRRIVDDAVGLTAPLAGKEGLQLTAEVRPEVPSLLRGEPGRIRQILLYAIRRAIQLAAHGEITLDVAVESSLDSITTVRFTTRHTDTDLSPEESHRSFAPNSHLEGLTAESRGGRGLGLAIARHLVELMGGRIELEANNGPGFTIWFTITLDNYKQATD